MADVKPDPYYTVQVILIEITPSWSEPKKPSYPQDGIVYHEASSRSVLDMKVGAKDKEAALGKAQSLLEVERDN